MAEDKIASFYDDPVKKACDDWSFAKGFSFRKVTIDDGFYWRAQHWARFLAFFSKGAFRLRSRVSPESKLNARPSPSSLSSSA
jgi:hypothetical protein